MGQPVAVVLGGAGFIGSNLASRLEQDGYTVRRVDIRLDRYAHDLRNYVECVRAIGHADVVFHLAADMGGVGYFHRQDYYPFLNNMQITLNVLRAVEDLGVGRLFYASSACAYPTGWQSIRATRAHLLTESALECADGGCDGDEFGPPDQMYGREKLMGLRLCERAPFDARVGILHTVYGPGQEREGERMKFPAAVATKALRSRDTGCPLELWGDGTQQRSYLYVDDAVEKILRVTFDDRYDGPVNIGSQGAVSCRQVAELCLELVGADVPIVTNPTEPSGVLARDCDNSEWVRRYGQDYDRPLAEGFGQFLAWLDGHHSDAP